MIEMRAFVTRENQEGMGTIYLFVKAPLLAGVTAYETTEAS